MSRVYLPPISKFPDIQIPKDLNFIDIDINRIQDLYRVTKEKAVDILKEKYYGAERPEGFENWKEYWLKFSEGK